MEQPDKNRFGPTESLGMVYTLSSIWAMCVIPFFRTGLGSHALGFDAFFALILMLTAGAFMHAPEMVDFIAVWLVVVICHRVAGAWKCRRGYDGIHSRYQGDPLLARIPTVTAQGARGVLEPVVTFFVAMCICPVSPRLGGFLMITAGSLFIKNVIEVEIVRARVRRMRDAHIEQVYVSRRYREGE
jgi:hypothetical protein